MFDIPYQVPSRRTFLSLSALSAIAIAASPEMPDAFASPDPDIWSALCEKWTDIITGRNAAKTADPRARGSAVLAALRPVMMSVHFSHSADQISGSGEAKASGISGEAAIAMADSADKDRKVRREGT